MCNKKRSLAAYVQTNPLGDIMFSVFCAHQMLTLEMCAKMFEAAQSSKKENEITVKHQKFFRFGGQAHQKNTHSVRTECEV